MSNPSGLVSVSLSIPSPLADQPVMDAASLFDEEAVSVSFEKITDHGQDTGWTISWVFGDGAPDLHAMSAALQDALGMIVTAGDLKIQVIPDVNWLEESYKSFPAFFIGPFYIYGSHHTETPPADCIPLQIDAATAFGSGEHGTTRGCLEALIRLKDEGFSPQTILDMGSGSGILAIAAWKLWEKPVLAVDIDTEATIVASRHRDLNVIPGGESGMVCLTGDGYRADTVLQHSGFDLILANILAGPLKDMAPDLAEKLNSGGRAVLSGLLVEQEAQVVAAHEAAGLELLARIPHQEWQTLVMGIK